MSSTRHTKPVVANLFAQSASANVAKAPIKEAHSKCEHCGKNGHDMSRCFQLIGIPPNWEQET